REIIEDFARSAEYLAPIYDDLRQHAARGGMPGAPNREWLLGSRPETMGDTLTYLDGAYGGIQGYLETIGLTDGERCALRSLLAG
ncbi:MAG: tyrosine-protein phosphatase, partial [Chloroflexi bacterium]|nr:tyrosine-protein phosphatase [Chloroflexota bacterium]